MFQKVTNLAVLVFTGLALSTTAAHAGDYSLGNNDGQNYGPMNGKTSVIICNGAVDSIATFYTSETDIEHGLDYYADGYNVCDVIKTNNDRVWIGYDSSYEPGDQLVYEVLRNGDTLVITNGVHSDLDHHFLLNF